MNVVCGDEATFAVCDDGSLYHWGKRWEPDFERPVLEASREMTMTPTKVAGLADVVKCSVHAVGLLPWEGAGLWLYCGGSYVIGQAVYVGHERLWSDACMRGTLRRGTPPIILCRIPARWPSATASAP